MATGAIYLRPSADISLGHTIYPDTLTAGYLAISEEASDGSSTYLSFDSTSGAESYLATSSTFAFSGTLPEAKIKVLQSGSIFLGFNAPLQYGEVDRGEIYVTLYVEGTEIGTYEYIHGNSNTKVDSCMLDITEDNLSIINEHLTSNGSLPDVRASVRWVIDYNSTSDGKGGGYGNLTQMYISLTYEEITGLNIHRKVSGAWIQAQAAYQKQSGAWVEITEDECKDIIQKSFCIK